MGIDDLVEECMKNSNVGKKGEDICVLQDKSTRFFVLRDDIEEQEIEIKIVYSLHLPDGVFCKIKVSTFAKKVPRLRTGNNLLFK